MPVSRKVAYLAILVTLIAGVEFASAKPKQKRVVPAVQNTFSVVHAIPLGYGADVVDIYSDSTLIIDNATPGSIKTFTTTHSNITIRIYSNGVVPSATTLPLLSTSALPLSFGTTLSFVAHLNEAEEPRFSTFKDVVTRAGVKRSWMTVRHVAGAPALQFKLNGTSVFLPLANT